jgi:phosphate butyryltransferase
MKGLIETRTLLRPVVHKENGLNSGRVMSHFALSELPTYHKLIVNTDGGMIPYPSLNEKKEIIINAVEILHKLGYHCPKVAVLTGVEKVNKKMPETVDASELKAMNLRGEISGCVIEGPISYDLAMSAESAKIKKFECKFCGDFDILVVPNLAAGNILGKSWYISAGGRMAGIIAGANVPIVLTSRGASADEKYLSVALATLVSQHEG